MDLQPDKQAYFSVGYLNKTHGLKGEIQLLINFEELQRIKKLDYFFIPINGNMIPYPISSLKFPQAGLAYVCFEDVDSIEKAQKIIKNEVYIPLQQKPKLRKQLFTWFDVEQFEVIDEHYGNLGFILKVEEMPQQFVAFINYQSKEVMFPLHADFVKEIDKKEKKLHTQLPQGLIEIYL